MKTLGLFFKIKRVLFISLVLLFSVFAKASDFIIDGIAYNVVSLDDMTCEVTSDKTVEYSGSIKIPSDVVYNGRHFSVVGIGKNAFTDCDKISDVKLPESITYIGKEAFWNCTSLVSVNVPESITNIEEWAFQNCSSLESIVFPTSLTNLEKGVFYDCKALKHFEIPNNIVNIKEQVFYRCTSLESITIPESCKLISISSFNYCSGLKKVSILSKDISIFGYYMPGVVYPFNYCNNLKEVYLSSYMSIIMFNYPILENVTFFEGTNWSSDVNDFDDTINMKQFTILDNVPPTQEFNFSNSQFMNVSLIVPEGSIELYKSADPWSKFWNISEYKGETGVKDIMYHDVKKKNIKTIANKKIIIKTATKSFDINGVSIN